MAQLYTDYQKAGDDTEMKTAAAAYQKWYAENLPLIPLYTPNTIWVNHKNVIGWQPNQANIYPYYHDVWLAQ
jgi:ABC-type transport system substrate-binding protein